MNTLHFAIPRSFRKATKLFIDFEGADLEQPLLFAIHDDRYKFIRTVVSATKVKCSGRHLQIAGTMRLLNGIPSTGELD